MKKYTAEQIQSLDWKEHIRLRPGMYIGQLGDGSQPEDGIYLLIKEVVDNSIDEHTVGFGDKIVLKMSSGTFFIRDYGRGIPLEKLVDCVAKINTGGKYHTQAFQKSIGLNGVGLKAVNALSSRFEIISYRKNQARKLCYQQGTLIQDKSFSTKEELDGTEVTFTPDRAIFGDFQFQKEIVEDQVAHFAYLNKALTLYFNEKKYHAPKGLATLLKKKIGDLSCCYSIVHLEEADISLSFTHLDGYPEEQYFSFVNGQFTPQGGTHLIAIKEAILKQVRSFYKKKYEGYDFRKGIMLAFSIRIQDPIFESQTKTRLSSSKIAPEGPSLRAFIQNFVQRKLDDYLHKHPTVANQLEEHIKIAEKERKSLNGIKKLARSRAKKATLHNKKLRDCSIHFCGNNKRKKESTIFITEGSSASGSITQVRDVQTQAVFSLKGKPLNCFGQSRKIVYENEEFNLLQHALNIEKGLAHLRYNRIILATDADVDGMHIRLLLLTYFLQFFPELVAAGHLYILETPLFRVRKGGKSVYCYSEEEKKKKITALGRLAEVTRFKGLGEISATEFKTFIGSNMRLQPIIYKSPLSIAATLQFYMGKNSPERQQFIIEQLRSSS